MDPLHHVQEHGYGIFHGLVEQEMLDRMLAEVESTFGEEESGRRRGGIRFPQQYCPALLEMIESDPIRRLAVEILGHGTRNVRSILFDKTPHANWKVAWHQDLSIAVQDRHEAEGYGPWSTKQGVPHVQPPLNVLESMITLRIHLDPCHADKGPLQVIPGSHRTGKLNPAQIREWVRDHKAVPCTGDAGSVVAMRPLLLHASSPATVPGHRRILHLEFSGAELPDGLAWRTDR